VDVAVWVGVTVEFLLSPTHPVVITTDTSKTIKRRYFIPVLSFE
jgi:hypothetical protein